MLHGLSVLVLLRAIHDVFAYMYIAELLVLLHVS